MQVFCLFKSCNSRSLTFSCPPPLPAPNVFSRRSASISEMHRGVAVLLRDRNLPVFDFYCQCLTFSSHGVLTPWQCSSHYFFGINIKNWIHTFFPFHENCINHGRLTNESYINASTHMLVNIVYTIFVHLTNPHWVSMKCTYVLDGAVPPLPQTHVQRQGAKLR